MSVTWGDLKAQLVDLGFEEDEITSETEYGRLIRNSTNRALDIVYQTVALRIEGYYKVTQSWGYENADGEWVLPKPRHIDESTEDDYRISLADNLTFLVALLAAHYVWLDDDITKATLYWNEYDSLKQEIISIGQTPKKSKIVGGVSF